MIFLECTRTISSKTSGKIQSLDFPSNYPPNRDCTWTVEGTYGNRINITFSFFSMETCVDCSCDYVQVDTCQRLLCISVEFVLFVSNSSMVRTREIDPFKLILVATLAAGQRPCLGGCGERSWSAAAIHLVAMDRTPNLPVERRTLYHWPIAAQRVFSDEIAFL